MHDTQIFLNKVIFTILNNTVVYQQRLVPTFFFNLMRAVLFILCNSFVEKICEHFYDMKMHDSCHICNNAFLFIKKNV